MFWSVLSCSPAPPPVAHVSSTPADHTTHTTHTAQTAHTAHTGESASGPPALEVGLCDVEAGAPLVPRVVYTTSTFEEARFDGLIGNVFTDAAALDAYLAGRELPPAEVEFATEVAAVVGYHTNGSCGVAVSDLAAWDVDGAPHVAVSITDDSFGCASSCDAEATAVAVVAVPIGAAPPTACGQVGGGCGPLP